MDMYKKKSLKFSHEQFSRDSRHAETLRARESSRFKRLSIIRSIIDSGILEDNSMETKAPDHSATPVFQGTTEVTKQHKDSKNSHEISAQKNEKKPSRLELLKKWKEEKLKKQELEKQLKKKPFSAGVTANQTKNSIAKPSQNFTSSFMNQSTMKFNSSIMKGSRILPPSSLKPPKPASNTKLAAPSSSIQPSRVPYNFKAAYSATKPVRGTIKAPTTMLKKPATNVAPSTVPVNKFASTARTVTTISKIGNTRSIPVAGIPKSTKMKENSSIKMPNQQSSVPKGHFSRAVSKPVQKIPVSNIGMVPNTLKAPNKPIVKDILKPVKNVPPRNNLVFKKPTALKAPEETANTKKGSYDKEISKKPQAKFENNKIPKSSKEVSKKHLESSRDNKKSAKETVSEESLENNKDIKNSTKETVSDQSIESIPDICFNCDISVIKPASFAPIDFKFQPPSMNFFLDEDPWDALQVMKRYMSRTSTPSKSTSGITSDFYAKETKDSIDKNPVVEHEKNEEILCQKTPDKSLKSNANFKFSLSGDFLGMETPDILLNNEIMDDMDGKSDKNQKNMDEIASCNLPPKMSDDKEIHNESLEKKTPVKQACIDSCKNEITVKDLLSESLFSENELKQPIVKENSEEIAPAAPLISEGTDEIASEKSTINEVADKVIPGKPLISEVADEISPEKSISEVADKVASKKPLICELSDDIASEKLLINEIALENPLILISEIAPENPLISEIAPEKPLMSEFALVATPGTSLMSGNGVPCRSSQEFAEITTESLLKEVKGEIIPVESENNVLNDNPDESIECCTLKDFKIDDVKKILEAELMLMKLEEEEDKDVSEKLEAVNLPERKSTGFVSKRVSMLKSVSVLNAISETSELDESNIFSPAKSSKKHQNASTPRRSMRLSTSHKFEISDNLKTLPVAKENELLNISVTPRRSTRLYKRIPNISENKTIDVFSPFKEVKSGLLSTTPRRSMRLINLNTPEENEGASCSKSNLSADFERLKLSSENVDPNDLIDFENSPVAVRKPKKISLLYSPDKRKSIRRSINGDLMYFSPGS